MYRLQTFSAYELNLLACGEQTPSWTREDILNFTEPKYGYTKDRYIPTPLQLIYNHLVKCVLQLYSVSSLECLRPEHSCVWSIVCTIVVTIVHFSVLYIFSSPGYQKFVNVICEMTGDERKVRNQYS